ncbi:MAG: winged helix-turn-helix domain-containing protein [Candidatus Geothermarchaeales archaeon]
MESVLESVSNPVRLRILSTISERGEASYTDLLSVTESQGVSSSALAYHLNELKEGLFVYKNKRRKYSLTERGMSVVKSLFQMSQQLSSVEKKQWLQDGRATLITRHHIRALLSSMGLPLGHQEAVISEVQSKLQSMPYQTIHPSLVLGLIGAALVRRELYEFASSTISLGPSLLQMHSDTADLRRPSHEDLARASLDYVLQKFLPLEVREAHYMGAIDIENHRDPFRIYHAFITPSTVEALRNGGENPRFETAAGMVACLNEICNDVTIADPHLVPWDSDGSWSPALLREAAQTPFPSETTICYHFPEGLSPKSAQGRSILSAIRRSAGESSRSHPSHSSSVYLLPPAAAFDDTYLEILAQVLSETTKRSGNALFGNVMFPWQRPYVYSRSGMKAPVEEGTAPAIHGFCTINLPWIAASSDTEETLFKQLVRDAVDSCLVYFQVKKGLLHPVTTGFRDFFQPLYCINLYGIGSTCSRFTGERLPRREALTFTLDMLKDVKLAVSKASRESGLDITFSSLDLNRNASFLLEKTAALGKRENGGIWELVDEGLIHTEAVLQKFIPGGRSPRISLETLSGQTGEDAKDILVSLFSEEELSFIPLRL